jgi:hypothetical protein
MRYRSPRTAPIGKRPSTDDREDEVGEPVGKDKVGMASGASGAPQLLQNRLLDGTSEWQEPHCMTSTFATLKYRTEADRKEKHKFNYL